MASPCRRRRLGTSSWRCTRAQAALLAAHGGSDALEELKAQAKEAENARHEVCPWNVPLWQAFVLYAAGRISSLLGHGLRAETRAAPLWKGVRSGQGVDQLSDGGSQGRRACQPCASSANVPDLIKFLSVF